MTMLKEEFLDAWPEHEKGWTNRAMLAYRVLLQGWCPYCNERPVDNAGRSCTECDDMLAGCDPGSPR